LFKLVSNIAAQNSLAIKNLSQGDMVETTLPARYQQTKIVLEAEGYYPNYIRFKKELFEKKAILKVESETVKLNVNSLGERKIQIFLSFTDYATNKDEYEKILQK